MISIVSAEQFNSQLSNNLSGKVYHNTTIIPGVIFAINRKKVAINYCQELMNKYPSVKCILIEDTDFIQVWYNKASSQILNQNPCQTSRSKIKISQEVNFPSQSLLDSKYLPIDRTFVLRCQAVLAEAIGPIAKIIIKKTISQNTQLNRQQFIAKLIQEIDKVEHLQDIKQQLNQLLSN